MSETPNKLIDSGLQPSQLPYVQSANCLFNFMGKFEFLKMALEEMKLFPRYFVENISYLDLEGLPNQKINRIAYPMLCFCDIKLHNIHLHTEGDFGYGKYGIGLNKEWCEAKGLNPITYLNPDSSQKIEFSRIFNQGIQS